MKVGDLVRYKDGTLGIITKVYVHVYPHLAKAEYFSVLFSDCELSYVSHDEINKLFS